MLKCQEMLYFSVNSVFFMFKIRYLGHLSRGRDRMVVEFTTTYAISVCHH